MADLTRSTSATPRVSVIIRTRNRPELLARALENALSQTFADREVIIVDDGDDPTVVQAIVLDAENPAVRIVDHTAGVHGRSRAANAGVRAAHGEFLVLHDDDDGWQPSFLAESVRYLDSHPDTVGVSARTEMVVHHVDEDGTPTHLERGLFNQGLNAVTIPDMLRANLVTTISLLYRSSIHDEVGLYDESLPVLEDWDFYLRMIGRYPIGLLPLPALAEFHHRPGAKGDAGNTVYVANDDHAAAAVRIRDQHLRRALAEGGSGAALHLAHEMQRLDELLRSTDRKRDAQHADVLAALDSISQRLTALESATVRLDKRIVERTSLSGLVGRLRSLFANKR